MQAFLLILPWEQTRTNHPAHFVSQRQTVCAGCREILSRKKGKGIFWKRTTSKLMKGFQNKFLFSSIFWATKELKR